MEKIYEGNQTDDGDSDLKNLVLVHMVCFVVRTMKCICCCYTIITTCLT